MFVVHLLSITTFVHYWWQHGFFSFLDHGIGCKSINDYIHVMKIEDLAETL